MKILNLGQYYQYTTTNADQQPQWYRQHIFGRDVEAGLIGNHSLKDYLQ